MARAKPTGRTPPPTRALIAAGSLGVGQGLGSISAGRSLPGTTGALTAINNWQSRAWLHLDTIGEVGNLADFYGGAFARIRLRPGWVDDDGDVGDLFDDDRKPPEGVPPELADLGAELIRSLKAPIGGQSALMAMVGRQLAIPGEFWLLGTDKLSPTTGQVISQEWEALSADELRIRTGSEQRKIERDGQEIKRPIYERRKTPGTTPEVLSDDCFVMRVWQRHQRWSGLATSSMQAVGDVLDELLLLTWEVQTTALSRLVGAGLFLVPSEANFEARDGMTGAQTLQSDLVTQASVAISDLMHPSRHVPLVQPIDSDLIPSFRHIRFDKDHETAVLLRREAVERFANGAAIPNEKITGVGQVNHWTGWLISEDAFKAYIDPLVRLWVDFLTAGYYQPALLARESDGQEPIIRRMAVTYDPSDLVVHPDRGKTAEFAYGTAVNPNLLISGSAFRRLTGLNEADKPDEEEEQKRLRIAQTLRGQPVETSPADGSTSEDVGGVDFGPPPNEPSTNGTGAVTASATNGHVDPLLAWALVAGGYAVERAMARAGAKLAAKANAKPELARKLKAARPEPHKISEVLGTKAVRELATAEDLLGGEFAVFARLAETEARERGHSDPRRVATLLVTALETETRGRLFDGGSGGLEVGICGALALVDKVLI